MSHHRAPEPMHICPRPSRALVGLLLVLHGCSLLLALTLPLPWPGRLAIASAVLISLSYQLAVHHWRRAPWAIRQLTWHPDGTWVITRVDGRQVAAHLASSTFVAVGLIVLDLRCGRLRRCSLPLFADSLDAEHARRLRARLRSMADDRARHDVPKAV